MSTVAFGRVLRRMPATARLLTEFRIWQLRRAPEFVDLRVAMDLLSPGDTAVDVGASVGNYAVAFSRVVGPHGRVIALEASPTVAQELRASTWLTNVRVVNAAASDHRGMASLFIPRDAAGREQFPVATLVARTGVNGAFVQVPCCTLDELLAAEPVVKLIKIDVEGHESAVIHGAQKTIMRHRPYLLVEIEARHLVGSTVADAVAGITGLGYECVALRHAGPIPWAEFSVEKWQTSVLRDGQIIDAENYINNFLFTPVAPGASRRSDPVIDD